MSIISELIVPGVFIVNEDVAKADSIPIKGDPDFEEGNDKGDVQNGSPIVNQPVRRPTTARPAPRRRTRVRPPIPRERGSLRDNNISS